MTLHPTPGMTNENFTDALERFWRALKRRHRPPGKLENLMVQEWLNGIQHAHALIRVEGKLTRQAIRAAKRLAGLRVSVKRIRNSIGAVRYVFKDMRSKKAELTPRKFKGRVFTMSQAFLIKPWTELWKEFREESKARRQSPD
jgi:hypothetical protein